MKKFIFITLITVLGLATLFLTLSSNEKKTITLRSDALLISFDIDALIKEADLIVIGEIKTILPSRWNGPNGRSDPKNASPDEIARAHGLFTDSLISIKQTLKGDIVKPIRVRSFIGETDTLRWENKSEPVYVLGKTYLLFLAQDTGATAKVEPGDYVSVGAYQGVYEIVDGRAISADDEWVLEDLIAYIEQSLSAETPASSTDLPAEAFTLTPEATELPVETTSPTP
ncbi:MAG TPA: hypothetical protein VFG81_20775 [Anaerolineales bacterium]|jgi:hypothetical protein|nr:hypothetical protein [Anaerolineales bacterium]